MVMRNGEHLINKAVVSWWGKILLATEDAVTFLLMESATLCVYVGDRVNVSLCECWRQGECLSM